ncbi:MAG: hypothetical protein ACRCY8_06470 [Dermatophilaceae bacterium]
MLYPRVRRFHRLGLLDVVGRRRRAGRAILLYRTCADEFFVPLSALPPGLEMLRSEQVWHDIFLRQLHRNLIREFDRKQVADATRYAVGVHLAPYPDDA